MPKETEPHCKIPEKFDDNVVLFLCRGNDRRKVRFRKRDSVPKFKHEVMYVCFYLCFICYFILISNTTQLTVGCFFCCCFRYRKRFLRPGGYRYAEFLKLQRSLKREPQKTCNNGGGNKVETGQWPTALVSTTLRYVTFFAMGQSATYRENSINVLERGVGAVNRLLKICRCCFL